MMRGQRLWLEDSREYVRWREGIQSIMILLVTYAASPPPRDEFVIFYLPLRFKGVQINELSHYIVVVKRRSILLE